MMSKSQPLHPDTFYHIYNRGNNQENLFIEDRNYRYFLERYARYIEPVAATYAYCLLKNHFHLLVRIRPVEEQKAIWRDEAHHSGTSGIFRPSNPSRQCANLFNSYAKTINKAYGRTGRLFESRFKRLPVKSQGKLLWLVTYIHRNPEKHGLVDDFRNWPYSSYRALVSDSQTRIRREEVLDWFQGRRAFADAHLIDDDGEVPYLVGE